MNGSYILRVAIPVPLLQLFEYLPPTTINETDIRLLPGSRVIVPFGKQKKLGVIVAIATETSYPLEKLKKISTILDTTPLFPSALLELMTWASRYYQEALGEIFEAALPKPLRKIPTTHTKTNRKTATQPLYKLLPSATLPDNRNITLNNDQQQAIAILTKNLGRFNTFLLEGVTGSGKTEVYMQTIAAVLANGQQALILVPEIGLTPQLVTRLQSFFQIPIAVLHSGLTESKRLLAWEMARTGTASIVIGTRSAAFVPLKAPGIFIIDEEHDPSFKQQEGFRYHARDLLIMRGALEQCQVVLGSATPSLEALYNVQKRRFQHLTLPNRAGNALLPNITVLDIRHKKCDEGLSSQLILAISTHLKVGGQVLLFLNRRGYAPVLMCFTCGWIANCKNCDAKMTFHYHLQQLRCHHCEVVIPLLTQCPACSNTELKPIGVGTERLEAALSKHFPDINVIRIDRDTTKKKGEFQKMIDSIQTGEPKILLGTQMIAKGHHFPKVTLAALLDIDQALFSTDFRSLERLGQLITQVAGRSGREGTKGEVILQTCHKDHPLLKILLQEDYHVFAERLLQERQTMHLPPYTYQALLRSESKNSESALEFLSFLKQKLLTYKNLEIQCSGPVPAPMERRQGKFRAQLLIQANKRSHLQKCLADLIPKINTYPTVKSVKWSLDVDPIDTY